MLERYTESFNRFRGGFIKVRKTNLIILSNFIYSERIRYFLKEDQTVFETTYLTFRDSIYGRTQYLN